MALPIVPIAVAAGAFALARNIRVLPVNQEVEDSLDTVDEGVALGRSAEGDQVNGAYRYRRIVRFGKSERGFLVDASVLGRIIVKRV